MCRRIQLTSYCCGFAVSCWLFVGCSESRIPTYAATGVVRFSNGEPVRFGLVEFHSEKNGPSPRAKLDDQGQFSLGTFTMGDGAPAGEYRVIIAQHFDMPAMPMRSQPPTPQNAHDESSHSDARVAAEYAELRTSPLRATVTSDNKNRFEFVVAHPKRKLPKALAQP
jgi:hypothetical protein